MLIQNPYWYFKKAVPEDICDKIIDFGLKQQKHQAITGTYSGKKKLTDKEINELKKTRDSTVSFFSEKWIYDIILPYIGTANQNAKWNFTTSWTEPLQFTNYGINQHYDWHCDSWLDAYNEPTNPKKHGKIRKLSCILSLSNSNDYEGGDLKFWIQDKSPEEHQTRISCEEIKEKGTIVVFPSFMWHKVFPVTQGKRYTLVAWCCGDPFI